MFNEELYKVSKEELSAEIRRLNKIRSEERFRFNRGHFPAGTVALFERPTGPWVKEEDRLFPEQRYALREETVLEVVANGHDSYVAKLDRPCELIEGLQASINISYCRGIIKRGDGKEVSVAEEHVKRLSSHKALHPYDPRTKKTFNKHPSKYYIEDLRFFILHALSYDMRYNGGNGDHLHDIDAIYRSVADHPSMVASVLSQKYITTWLISKKKFHKILKVAVTKGRTSRLKAYARDNVVNHKMYMEDMEREWERENELYGDLDEENDIEVEEDLEAEAFNHSVMIDDMSDHPEDDIRLTDGFHNQAFDQLIRQTVEATPVMTIDISEKPKTIGDLLREQMSRDESEASK